MPNDAAEFMLGKIVVTPVFFESKGLGNGGVEASTEDWSPQLIAATKAKIQDGLQWWVDTLATLNTVHSLEYVYDWQYADTPVPTLFEPIAHNSDDYLLWGGEFLRQAGFQGTQFTFSDDMLAFNHAQRTRLETHWAFTIFVANSENDSDDAWEPGGRFSQGFAFANEKFMVLPSGRPASSFTHETGHMFWALDEYKRGGNYVSTRGYYNTQNLNAWDNPTPGFDQVPSIMERGDAPTSLLQMAYAGHTSSPSSLEMIGWRDGDGDGIFDVLDVPHSLTGTGFYDRLRGVYRFQGASSVRTLANLNPRSVSFRSGSLQNDITINQITNAEYRIDGGAWQRTAVTYNKYNVDLNLQLAVPVGFQSIEIRTIDASTGVTSPAFLGTPAHPSTMTESGISGFVRHDTNENGVLEPTEVSGVAGWTVQLVDGNGAPIVLADRLEPDQHPADATPINAVHPKVTLSAGGSAVSSNSVLSVLRNEASTGGRVFGFQTGSTIDTEWTQSSRRLRIDFTDPVSQVQIDAIGTNGNDYGRLEIYDSANRLLGRYTTRQLRAAEVETMTLSRGQVDIKYAIATAHLDSNVLLDNLRFGVAASTVTDSSGAYRLPFLPSGTYHVQALPNPGLALTTVSPEDVDLSAGGVATNVDFGARLTTALSWQNPLNRLDVDFDNVVSHLDVLSLIVTLNQPGSRRLPPISPQAGPPPFYDVNGDGSVSPIDVLLVSDFLQRQSGGGSGESSGGGSGAAGRGSSDGSSGGDGSGEGEYRPPVDWSTSPSAPRGDLLSARLSDWLLGARANSDTPAGRDTMVGSDVASKLSLASLASWLAAHREHGHSHEGEDHAASDEQHADTRPVSELDEILNQIFGLIPD